MTKERSTRGMESSSDQRLGGYWRSHYDSMAGHESLDLFDAEARDYFSRLGRVVPLAEIGRALDFGCGLGFVSELLAKEVSRLYFWDYSDNMLETAKGRLAKTTSARVIDLSSPEQSPDGDLDLIIVNSVIQYMSESDFSEWLARWRRMLAEDGVLIISDLILPQHAFFREVRESLAFSAKREFLVRTLLKNLSQYARYLKARSDAPMTRYSQERFLQLVEGAGFSASILPENLTYRTNRFSAQLRRASS